MSEMREKLVEEIAERIQFVADIGLQDFQATSALADAFERERRGRDLAEELIARIGKAYAEGLEIPGEVDRFDFHMKNWDKFEHWVAQTLHDDADIFIALHKEEAESLTNVHCAREP